MKLWDIIKKSAMRPTDHAFGLPPRPEPCFIESMKILEYKKGDVIVLKYSKPISVDARAYLIEAVKKAIDPEARGVRVMLMDDGMDIGVLRGES